jgi:hypothetical protein
MQACCSIWSDMDVCTKKWMICVQEPCETWMHPIIMPIVDLMIYIVVYPARVAEEHRPLKRRVMLNKNCCKSALWILGRIAKWRQQAHRCTKSVRCHGEDRRERVVQETFMGVLLHPLSLFPRLVSYSKSRTRRRRRREAHAHTLARARTGRRRRYGAVTRHLNLSTHMIKLVQSRY